MKERDLDKDTIVAYHAYLQTRIHNELNNVGLGPGWLPCRVAQMLGLFSFASLITGILVICLRHRHVYLVDWWHAFLGPFFIILALLLASVATYLVITAKRRSNRYRRELFFRPIGDYGVAIVHKSTIMHEQEHKTDLKSGTNPHREVRPNAEAFSSHRDRDRKHRRGHENRAYNDNGHDERGHHDRDRRDRDRRPHDGERRRHDDRDRDDRRRRDDRGERRRPPDDRRHDDRRRRDDRERGEPEKRRPPPEEDRGDLERIRDPEKRRLAEEERSASTQGGRRAVRGIPKIAVTDKVVLDEDFGRVAGHPPDDESEL